MDTEKLKVAMNGFRESLKVMVAEAVEIKKQAAGVMNGEVAANITLAYRHLEDAAMRFGKAIQAGTDGVSPLGGPDTPR